MTTVEEYAARFRQADEPNSMTCTRAFGAIEGTVLAESDPAAAIDAIRRIIKAVDVVTAERKRARP